MIGKKSNPLCVIVGSPNGPTRVHFSLHYLTCSKADPPCRLEEQGAVARGPTLMLRRRTSMPSSAVLGKSPRHRKRPRGSHVRSRGSGVQEPPSRVRARPGPARCSALPSALTSKSGVGSRGAFGSLGLLQFCKKTKQLQAIRLPDVDVPVRPRVSAHADRELGADSEGAVYGPRPPRRPVCGYPDSHF